MLNANIILYYYILQNNILYWYKVSVVAAAAFYQIHTRFTLLSLLPHFYGYSIPGLF